MFLIAVTLFFAQASPAQKYQRPDCGYAFEYPRGWEIVKNADDIRDSCVTTLRPTDFASQMADFDVDVYTLTVRVHSGTFDEAAGDNGFELKDGKWVVSGRMGMSESAKFTSANGWTILRGDAEVGCFHKGGGYAGLCAEPRIVAKHKRDNRILEIVGGSQSYKAIDTILTRFAFLGK